MRVKIVFALFSLMLVSVNVHAVITTTTKDYLRPTAQYNVSQSALFNLVSKNQDAVIQSELGSFLIPPPLEFEVKDKQALGVIAQLMLANDERAPLALANYIKRYPEDLFALYLASVKLIEKQKYNQAKAALNKIIAAYPSFSAAHTLIGMIYYSEQKFVEGNTYFVSAITQENPDFRAFKYLIWHALQQQNLARATMLSEFLHSFNTQSQLSQPVLELSEFYRLQGKYNQVVTLLTPMVKTDKAQDVIAQQGQVRLLEALAETGQTHQGDNLYAALVSSNANNLFVVTLAHSKLLNQKGQHNEAIKELNNIELEGLSGTVVRLVIIEKIKTHTLLNNYTAVDEMLAQFLATFNGNVTSGDLLYLSNFLIQTGQGNKLISLLENHIDHAPNKATLYSVLADLYLAAGDKYEAQRVVNILIEQSPNSAHAYYQLGILHYNNMRNAAAQEALEKAVKLAPQRIDYWMALVGAMHDHRQHNHASGMAASDHQSILPVFNRAIQANPGSALLYFEKGLTAYSGSELDLAANMFNKALSLDPFYLEAMAMYSITLVDMNNTTQDVQNVIERGLRIAPQSPALIDSKGWLLTQQGQLDKGEAELSQALLLMPNDEAVIAHLAFNAALKHQPSQAQNYALNALQGTLPEHTASDLRALLNKLSPADTLTLDVHKINDFGVGNKIGTVTIEDIANGVSVTANVTGLPPGNNGLHFHEKPTCDAGDVNGVRKAGVAAGDHYGHTMSMMNMDMTAMSPQQHAKHMLMMKPKGDLPPLPVNDKGEAIAPVVGKGLSLQELRGRSLMIHAGPDVNGASGPKIACVVII